MVSGWLLLLLAATFSSVTARADPASSQLFGATPSGPELAGRCTVEDRAAFLYVCTDHGLFAFDGRQFSALGEDQNLPAKHDVRAVVIAPSGRLVVRYVTRIFVADRQGSAATPPTSMTFKPLAPSFPQPDLAYSLAPWRNGVVAIDDGGLRLIVVPPIGAPSVHDLVLPPAVTLPPDIVARQVFGLGGHLWFTRSDGRLCVVDDTPRCFGSEDGLPVDNWQGMARTSSGTILVRSPTRLAKLPPGQDRWSVTMMPNRNDAYDNYAGLLALFDAPNGGILTQTLTGLAELRDGAWSDVTISGDYGIITSSLVDRSGSLWIQTYGNGLARLVNYGEWQTLTHAEGLSPGIPWQTAADTDGSLWVATDTSLDRIKPENGHLRVSQRVHGASYALALNDGLLWSSDGASGARVVDPSTGTQRRLAGVDSITMAIVPGQGGTTWLGTGSGIFRCRGRRVDSATCTRASPFVARDMITDGMGGVFYLSASRIHHLGADGSDTQASDRTGPSAFSAYALVRDSKNTFWVGGDGGLFHVNIDGAGTSRSEAVTAASVGMTTPSALLVDHRGWLWVGGDSGLTVYDGHRWRTLDTEDGLPANDIDERGLREDADGTIWITTSAGVSHLLHPEQVFAARPLDVVISRVSLDGHMVRDVDLPFNRKPLLIEVGTPGYAAQQSVTFRYRMSGVDEDWVETSSGRIFYPFVPPGRHRFQVFAVDSLKHRVSAPQTLRVSVAFPWWRQWWAEMAWLLLTCGALYGLYRLRVRVERARQAELERRVEEVTAAMRKTQAALAYQATHDQLTGLLNRSAIENKLAASLRDGGDRVPSVVVGLVDIDHFKAINDGWGHLTGDNVLRDMGALAAGILRAEEYAGRYGGEEILVVLHNADNRAVSRLAAFHQRVRMHTFGKAGSHGVLNVTCSIGMAAVFAGDNWESLIGRADRALYNAKRNGRDRIAGLAGSAEPDMSLAERVRGGADGP